MNELNELLRIASNSSAYYREKYQGIELPLSDLSEFGKKIPTVTKEAIKYKPVQLRTELYDKRFKHRTSGSSGEPVIVYISGIAESYRISGVYRALSWFNIKPHEKFVRIVGRKNKHAFRDKVLHLVRPRYDINVFELNSDTINKFYKEIEEFRPAYIRGYKSALLQFAELLEAKKLYFRNFRFRLAVVTAEVLYEEERKYIEKVLGCRLVNEYGASDAGGLAFECPFGSMHIYEEGTYVTTDKNNDVYVTELHNYCMPLINYKIEDKVIISDDKCSCGMHSRIIKSIEGRDIDFVLKQNGEKINGSLFVFFILELDELGMSNSIYKWKAVQNKNNFTLTIVPMENYSKRVEEHLRKRLIEEVGEGATLEINLVDYIPREKSGKQSYFRRIE